VRKVMLLLAVAAVLVLLFAPVALARHHTSMSTASASGTSSASATSSASGTASASSSATATGKKGGKLPKTGGPAPMALLAGVMLAGSGAVAWAYLRRREVS
jgi:LPXTG-motif cell wall-anchored protein